MVSPTAVTYSFMPAITQIRRGQPFLGPGEESRKGFGSGGKFIYLLKAHSVQFLEQTCLVPSNSQ